MQIWKIAQLNYARRSFTENASLFLSWTPLLKKKYWYGVFICG
jgi:hypothetical protein